MVVGMGDNEGIVGGGDPIDNQCDVVVGEPPNSPWKTSSAASPVTGPYSESWPALSDAQQRSKNNGNADSNSSESPHLQGHAETDGCNVLPVAPASTTVEQQKFHGRGNTKFLHRPYSMQQNKTGPKHRPNGVPPFPVALPYYPPTLTPVFHTVVPCSPIPVHGYAYRFPPGPLLRADAQLENSGSDTGQAFASPVNGSFHPSPRADSSAHDSSSVGRRPITKGQGGQINPSWNNQQPAASNNFHMQQTMGVRPSMRPPIFGPTGFVNRPNFQGPPGAVYYYPVVPPGSVRVPYSPFLVPFPVSPGSPLPPSPTAALRTNIVKQIEYYFSDENLRNDYYLISLMDDQGWVPISIIAGFKRVQRMNVEIPFILDALQASETVEVQGEKVRRCNEWSKWIPASLNSKTSVPVMNDMKNNDPNENQGNRSEGKIELPPTNASFVDGLSLNANAIKESINNDTNQSKDECLSSVEALKVSPENSNSSVEMVFQSNSNRSKFPAISHEADSIKPVIPENCENRQTQVLSNLNMQNLDDLSNDCSSTFMLDEELEQEQKMIRNDWPSNDEKVDGEDDEITVSDQAVERLVIVTQNNQTSERPGEESKTMSDELASAISDGLYFYEQELNSKRARCRHNKPINKSRDENSRNSAESAAVLNSRVPENSAGRKGCEEPGNFNSQKKQIQGSSKQHSIHKQRLFYGNFKAHGSGQNSVGAIPESPPSDAVGFFFGSTPPDNHGVRPSKLSASPQSNLSGSSPPVGSVPKSFPTFQHPSHKLLEENGFKQQLYKKYHKRCLNERKKMGIGCSEEMNTLYRFWCYFLRNMFIPSMYNEFQKLALEDASARYNYGMHCLFRFYSYGLEKEFREDVYEDFEQLALDFYKRGNLYGLEKYWAFHHYREARDQKEPLKKHPELDRLLREQYRSLEDFKVKSVTAQVNPF